MKFVYIKNWEIIAISNVSLKLSCDKEIKTDLTWPLVYEKSEILKYEDSEKFKLKSAEIEAKVNDKFEEIKNKEIEKKLILKKNIEKEITEKQLLKQTLDSRNPEEKILEDKITKEIEKLKIELLKVNKAENE